MHILVLLVELLSLGTDMPLLSWALPIRDDAAHPHQTMPLSDSGNIQIDTSQAGRFKRIQEGPIPQPTALCLSDLVILHSRLVFSTSCFHSINFIWLIQRYEI